MKGARQLGDLVADGDLRAIIAEHGEHFTESGKVVIPYSGAVLDVFERDTASGMWRVVEIRRQNADGSTYGGRYEKSD